VLKSCGRLANETGFHLSFTGGEIVNVFDTGTVTIQGKNSDRTQQILGSEQTVTHGATRDKPPEPLSSVGVPKQSAMKSGYGNGQQSDGVSKPTGSGYERMSQIMQISLQHALEAASATERYAQEIGFNDSNGDSFRFSHADIRAVGLSLFIEARRRANGY
jgi:hypothetical protein